ncbi:MAG: hypothetical protein M3340_01725 [Actinomycetota bacterium]|nr:hypothetical protein [Actinomycetota bacterium]
MPDNELHPFDEAEDLPSPDLTEASEQGALFVPEETAPDVRLPVVLSKVDPAQAKRLLATPKAFAAALVESVDAYGFGQFAETTIDFVRDGRAAEGLNVQDLADEAHAGRGRLMDRFTADWHAFVGLVIRGLLAAEERKIFYEELRSVSVGVHRNHKGMGKEKCPGFDNTLHLLVLSGGRADRHIPFDTEVLTTGTHDDYTCERCNPDRITDWTKKLGQLPPGTLGEHVEAVLGRQQRVRAEALRAIKSRREVFTSNLTWRSLAAAFSPYLLMPGIEAGPQNVAHRSYTDELLPGRDAHTVEAVAAVNRRAVLYCGRPDGQGERNAVARFTPLQVGRLPLTYDLGISRPENVQYSWCPKTLRLARQVVGRGERTELWQLVNFVTEDDLWHAISLVERHEQAQLPDACLERWDKDCGPGFLKARHPLMCSGCISLLNTANAALVEADRRRQSRGDLPSA